MQHADKLIARIIFLDGMPNMQVLDPLHIGQTVKVVLDNDLQLEMAARASLIAGFWPAYLSVEQVIAATTIQRAGSV
jgi:bacterioferritin (cytochrome b1)